MRQIQNGELAEPLDGCLVIGAGGIFGGRERSERPYRTGVPAYDCLKCAVRPPIHASVLPDSPIPTVRAILCGSCGSQICSPTVETVAVFVVNSRTVGTETEDKPMQRGFTGFAGQPTIGVELAGFSPRVCMPFMREYPFGILGVDNGGLTSRKWYPDRNLRHRVSFSARCRPSGAATLLGTHFISKGGQACR